MKMYARQMMMAACAAALLAAGSALATDGTVVVNNAVYNSSNGWANGIIAGDAGSTLTLAKGVAALNVNTNVVLGTIQLAKDNVQSDISINLSNVSNLDEYNRYYASWGLTLDSGYASVPAQILLLPEDTTQTRMLFYPPLRLNSDLYISYRYKVPNSDNRGPFLHFMVPITENVPGRNVTIDSTSGYAPVVFTDRNTFSGALRISNGVLRVDSATQGVGGDQGQLGLGSAVYVSTNASLNLFGYDGGQGKTLYLAGSGAGGCGAFGSSCGLPNHTSVWHGAVCLTGNAALGAAQGGGQYGMSRWGTVTIDGPISEQGGSFSLEKVSANFLFLNRANSYSGGTKLTGGLLTVTNANALGSGPLFFNGGRLLLTSDLDLSQTALITTNAKAMYLEIAEGVTATQRLLSAASNVKDGLYRYGRGTLVLAANGTFASTASMQSYWYEGTTIADYSTSLTNKLPTGGAFRMAGGTFLFKNNPLLLPGSFTQLTGGLYLEAGKASVVSNLTHVGEILVNFQSTLSRAVGSTLILGGEEGSLQLSKACINGIYPDACITYGPYTWACTSNSTYAVGYKSYSTSWSANTNVDVTASASIPDATAVNSLRFNTAADVTVDQAGSLNLASGGILVTPSVGTNTVTIQGGTITSGNTAKDLVVHQHSPGTLVMKSTIASNGTSLVTLTKTGVGTLVLDCTNMTLASSMYITGGTVEFRRASDLNLPSATPSTNTTTTITLCGGGIRFAGDSDMINFYPNISTPSIKRWVSINVAGPQGGVIDVPEGKTVTNYSFTMNGPFIKRGKGTLTFISGFACGREDYPFTIEEGSVEVLSTASLSSQPMRVIAKPGTTLKGGWWLWGRGWGRADMCDSLCIEIQKGDKPVTIDLNGVSNSGGGLWAYTPNHDYFEGNGDLVITNSSVTAASYSPGSSIHRKFTGTITLAPNVWNASGGFGIPNGTLVMPQVTTANFGGLSPTLFCGFGALTGNGILTAVTEYPRTICVGDDRTNAFEYTGFLKGYFSGASWLETPTNGVRFVKTGTCTWRVSGATNVLNHQTVVRKGTLLAGNNSNGTGPGAFGKGAILLGDDKSDTNSSLAFLTDGGFTISNLLVQGTLDSTVTMSVGGNSTTAASRFTSNLLLSRALRLHSAGGDVTFSGAITGPGGITKTGVGTVYLTGVVSNTGPTSVQQGSLVVQSNVALTNTLTVAAGSAGSGTLAVTGNLTLGSGAMLAVSVGTLVRDQTYTLVSWTGARTGSFAPVTGLPANWHTGYRSNSFVLYYAPPGSLIGVL